MFLRVGLLDLCLNAHHVLIATLVALTRILEGLFKHNKILHLVHMKHLPSNVFARFTAASYLISSKRRVSLFVDPEAMWLNLPSKAVIAKGQEVVVLYGFGDGHGKLLSEYDLTINLLSKFVQLPILYGCHESLSPFKGEYKRPVARRSINRLGANESNQGAALDL